MVVDWQRFEVSSLIKEKKLFIGDGYRAKNKELSDIGFPFARAGNINNGFKFDGADCFPEENLPRVGNKVSEPGDVVFTSKGTVGRFAFVRQDTPRFVYSPQLCFWRSLDSLTIDPRFLFYWMFGREFFVQFKGVAGQTDMAEYVSLTDQRQMHITLPPIDEQHAIAHILGTLDNKIELNRRMNETLEGIAKAIFKSWFVDFDPVRAKVADRDTGLARHIADLFPGSFEDSELGEIPKGWEIMCLGDVAGLLGGYAFKSRDWVEQGVPVVKIGSVKPGIVDLNQVSFVPEDIANATERYRLMPGDLLIGMTGYVGEVGLVPPTDNPPLLNQRVGKFVMDRRGTEALGFVYCLTRRSEFKTAVETKSHGTAQANVSAEGILSVSVVVPQKSLREIFNQFCSPLIDRILSKHAESQNLAGLRDTLLPKLISGEQRIKDAEKLVRRIV